MLDTQLACLTTTVVYLQITRVQITYLLLSLSVVEHIILAHPDEVRDRQWCTASSTFHASGLVLAPLSLGVARAHLISSEKEDVIAAVRGLVPIGKAIHMDLAIVRVFQSQALH